MITGVLVGAGQRGMQVYAAYALKNPQEFQIVAVAEPNVERRQKMQELHHIPDEMAFVCWEDLFRKDVLADCALVCTMDWDHAEPVKAALQKGYHVLCEKPISPDPSACVEMADFAKQYGKTLTICHVLRYSPFFTKIKSLLDSGTIGKVASIQHIECVGYWHQAHSFVRGNWRSSKESSPMILQKCCHDMDILSWLIGQKCVKVSSFGSLMHFRPENAPPGSTKRCLDGCDVRRECPYDCGKIYLEDDESYSQTIRKVVALEGTIEAVEQALRTGPYGRCVYHCDNDVVDHQVVNLEYEGGVTVSFTMCAFTDNGSRFMNIMGTRGQILCDMKRNRIEVLDFRTGMRDVITVKVGNSGHSGSDDAFMRGFLRTVETNGAFTLSSAEQSVESHLIALAAEESRVTGKNIDMKQFAAQIKRKMRGNT